MPSLTMSPDTFVYEAHAAQPVACLVCGAENPSTPTRDRYGFCVGTSRCACGFAYLNPQLSAEGYAAFYAHGYRATVGRFYQRHGLRGADTPAEVEAQARDRGTLIGSLAARLWAVRPLARLCDVGGSTGGVAEGIRGLWPVTTITVLDPNAEELAQARARGHETVCALAEAAPDLPLQDVFVCVQTLDHARDPLAVLRWMRDRLAPGGWLYVDVVNAGQWAANTGCWPQLEWKLDHPCYWSPETLAVAVTTTGWRVRAHTNRGLGGHHYGVWCEGRQ